MPLAKRPCCAFAKERKPVVIISNYLSSIYMQRIQSLVKQCKYKNPSPRGTAKRELKNHSLPRSICEGGRQGLIPCPKSQTWSMGEPRLEPRFLNFPSRILHLSLKSYDIRKFMEEGTNESPWEIIVVRKFPTSAINVYYFNNYHN